MGATLELKAAEAPPDDVGKGWARLDEADQRALGLVLGDLVEICGDRATVARVTGTLRESAGKRLIHVDGLTRENAGVGAGGTVIVKKLPRKTASTVVITPLDGAGSLPDPSEVDQYPKLLQGLACVAGDKLDVPLLAGKRRFFRAEATSPPGGVIINAHTRFLLKQSDFALPDAGRVNYEDVGGLDRELRLVRELVELPVRYAGAFERLGIEAPKGVLLHGPPGTGKTLIARAVAGESKLHFIQVNGPEIIHKFYGESEARLREIFHEAAKNAPSVIFIDEIDAIAPKRAEVLGEVEKRVVAQLLALMDGMVSRGHVIVIGATNIPNLLDPALRRPGRFDREIVVPAPNVEGRRAILGIHSRRMPLGPDVDLDRLAAITHAFVGADLAVLCKEAGMVALRRHLARGEAVDVEAVLAHAEQLQVCMEDFLGALREVEPTAVREIYTERPKTRWSDVGGLSSVKNALLSSVEWPARYPELFAQGKVAAPRGILLTGPSGTGKTLVAKALAGESALNFIAVSVPILFSKWLGESEKALHEVFRKAKQSAPCILFFDDVETLAAPPRSATEGGAVSERMASQFMNELEGLTDVSQVIVLAATNREDLLDPALTRAGRLDHVLRLPRPSEAERLEIFRVHTRGRPLSDDVDLAELARLTDGLVGAQIASICRDAVLIAIDSALRTAPDPRTHRLTIGPEAFRAAAGAVLRGAAAGSP